MAVGSPVEVMEGESRFSDCFGLNKEMGLFAEGEGFSFSSDDMLGKEEGRSDGRHPPTPPSISIQARKKKYGPFGPFGPLTQWKFVYVNDAERCSRLAPYGRRDSKTPNRSRHVEAPYHFSFSAFCTSAE
jgi:hypothetical protein